MIRIHNALLYMPAKGIHTSSGFVQAIYTSGQARFSLRKASQILRRFETFQASNSTPARDLSSVRMKVSLDSGSANSGRLGMSFAKHRVEQLSTGLKAACVWDKARKARRPSKGQDSQERDVCTSTPSRDTLQVNCIAQLVTRPRRPSCLHTLEVFPAMYICACPHRALVLITVVHCLQMAEDCNSAA